MHDNITFRGKEGSIDSDLSYFCIDYFEISVKNLLKKQNSVSVAMKSITT